MESIWTAVGAIAQGVASIGAILALYYSLETFQHSLKISHYGELDRMYFDILKIAMEHPELTKPIPPSGESGKQADPYEAYAFMVWNFLETIYDRCSENQYGADDHLRSTWYPVMQYEGRLHREWFDRPDNARKFKEPFLRFVRGGFQPWSASQAGLFPGDSRR